jgi:hypothetical protein
MMESEQLEMFEELMKRDEEIARLEEEKSKLTLENMSMQKTIDTILRVKCKRGEGAFSLNVELKPCIEKNAYEALDQGMKNMTTKPTDIVNQVLLSTLVGLKGTDIPCAVLHNNPPIVVYKDHNIWVVKGVNEFSSLYYKHMQPHVMRYSKEHVNDDTSDNQMTVLNTLLNYHQFTSCLKQVLRMYKDY